MNYMHEGVKKENNSWLPHKTLDCILIGNIVINNFYYPSKIQSNSMCHSVT